MIIGYDLRYSIEALSTRPVLSVIFPSVYTNPILNVPDQRVRLLEFSRCIEELLLGGWQIVFQGVGFLRFLCSGHLVLDQPIS